MKTVLTGTLIAFSLLLHPPDTVAEETTGDGRFTFSWPFAEEESMRPRGGTTQGPPVKLMERASADFRRLREPGISDFERDRRAILAMAGPYRVSFDFLEVIGFAPTYVPDPPYQSWATEHIYVVGDSGKQISLQHLMVMSFIDEHGETEGPFVTKHWRQDWHYEAPSIHVYRGGNTWRRKTLPAEKRSGRWAQTVWQVSDSPRYAAWGKWVHKFEYSTWTSGETWRPLPRREFSVREDYDALVGTNRQTVVATGWVHEQRNLKAVLNDGQKIERRIALEYGLARYERIEDYDFSRGKAYLNATRPFWEAVRDHWNRLLAENDVLRLKTEVNQTKLFEPLFERARAIFEGNRDFDPQADKRFIQRTINRYIAEKPGSGKGY